MHNFLVNLLIGIIGGIFSSIIVSRIFLIRQEYQNQLDVLRKNSYCLGSIGAFLDVIEIVLKTSYDTSVEIEKDPNYIATHNLKDEKLLIDALRKELLFKTITEIDQFNDALILTEPHLYKLHTDTIQFTKDLKDIKEYKFDIVDSSKKQLSELTKRYNKCFKEKSSKYFSLVIKDKIMIILYILFILVCIFTFITT